MQLDTDRLHIRLIQAEDWQSIQAIWQDFASSPYARYDIPHPADEETVRPKIAKWAQASLRREHLFFVACLQEQVIGYMAFHWKENGYETGYCFHSRYQGMGYARESFQALFPRLQAMGAKRVTAGTALNNLPSVRLLQKLGFRQVGTEQVSFYQDETGKNIVFKGGRFERPLP